MEKKNIIACISLGLVIALLLAFADVWDNRTYLPAGDAADATVNGEKTTDTEEWEVYTEEEHLVNTDFSGADAIAGESGSGAVRTDAGTAAEKDGIFTTPEEAADYLRQCMVERKNEITLKCYAPNMPAGTAEKSSAAAIMELAEAHTGVGCEGDYLKYQWNTKDYLTEYSGNLVVYKISITYKTSYDQEQQVTSMVDTVLDSLGVYCMASDYEKIKEIYDYICANVHYDYDHAGDGSYILRGTAYAALIDRTAICQGYAILFYRMTLDAGVDCRYVGNSSHVWDIVKIGDYYYNVDATWDAVQLQYGNPYKYFLTCDAAIAGDHVRDAMYDNAEFNSAYPMSPVNYTLPDDSGKFPSSGTGNPSGGNAGSEANSASQVPGGGAADGGGSAGDGENGSGAASQSTGNDATAEAPDRTAQAGDVNGDRDVNIADVQLLLKYVNGQDVIAAETACDVNGDGAVDIMDVQLLLKIVNKQGAVPSGDEAAGERNIVSG